MSMHAQHYIILGYDLSYARKDILDDEWKWTDEGERWTCYASHGHVQMFTDINNGHDLYLGYVVATRDYEDEETIKIELTELMDAKKRVDAAMKELSLKFPDNLPDFQMIIITEWL